MIDQRAEDRQCGADRPGAGPTVTIMGVRFDAVTEPQCARMIIDALKRGQGGWALTMNLDILRRCAVDARFRKLAEGTDLVVADGMPLVWASRLSGSPLPERVAGSNLVSSLSKEAAEAGFSVFLLGGEPGAAEGAAEALRRRFPALRVAGVDCPPMGFERDAEYMEGLHTRLAEARPDIVYVALGSPKQEYLIERLREQAPSAWWLGVGVSFSFLSGHLKRAPAWVQGAGLEWAHRLLREPRRLAGRYLLKGAPFAGRLMVWSLMRRLSGPPNLPPAPAGRRGGAPGRGVSSRSPRVGSRGREG